MTDFCLIFNLRKSGDTILNCVKEEDVGSETTYFLKAKR
jgi:hypothetical protein